MREGSLAIVADPSGGALGRTRIHERTFLLLNLLEYLPRPREVLFLDALQ